MTAMDAFEALALTQRPASEPWTPVTPFDFASRKAIEGEHPARIWHAFKPTSWVLDYGCGPQAHLVRLLTEIDVQAVGYDVQLPETASLLVHQAYELVICREVLEHLTLLDIRKTVQELCGLSTRFVYVTTRFSSEHDLLRVDTSDNLDPTHITIPSKDLLRLLFVLEGFKRRPDLEQAMDWQRKNRCLVYERVS
jgi:hypothetical protein